MRSLLFVCLLLALAVTTQSDNTKHTTKAPKTTKGATTTTTKDPTTTTQDPTTSSAAVASVLGIQLLQITNPSLNVQCFDYDITVGQGGLLTLSQVIISLPCLNLCTLLSTHVLDLHIPLDITGTVLGLPLVATGNITLDVSTASCGIVINIDLAPLDVNALDLITLDICLDLSLVLDLGFLLNGLLGGILGTVEVLLGSVLSSFSSLVPDLCAFAL